jgi:hypothetical protein
MTTRHKPRSPSRSRSPSGTGTRGKRRKLRSLPAEGTYQQLLDKAAPHSVMFSFDPIKTRENEHKTQPTFVTSSKPQSRDSPSRPARSSDKTPAFCHQKSSGRFSEQNPGSSLTSLSANRNPKSEIRNPHSPLTTAIHAARVAPQQNCPIINSSRCYPEGKRMASSLIGIQVPRKGLWVRVPCPPLPSYRSPQTYYS